MKKVAKKRKKKPVRSRAAKKKALAQNASILGGIEDGRLGSFQDSNCVTRDQTLASLTGRTAAGTITNHSAKLPAMEGGQCYKNAFIFAVCNEGYYQGIKVVHGYPLNTDGEVMGHAWVEWKGFCYDPYLDIQVPRDMYYTRGHIDPSECRHYPLTEARKLLKKEGWGPWEVVKPNAVFVETRFWSVNGPKNNAATWIWEELDGLEVELRGSKERNELAAELARAGVGDGDILLFYETGDQELRGVCMVSRDQITDDRVSDEHRYSYSVLENQLEFDPPARLTDLATSGFTQKRGPVAEMERSEFRELVDAMSAQSESMADSLTAWLDDMGVAP